MYKVTLAMPVYNVEKYVEQALLSALAQTFESIEFLIVDDKGTDKSMDIVNRIIASHPRGKDVRIIDHGVNQKLGAARNSAIREAKGEYLYFMDSDDMITEDCIELLYNKMQEFPADYVIGSLTLMQNETTLEKNIYNNLLLRNQEDIYLYQKNNNNPIPIITCNKLYNIHFLRNNKIFCIPYHLTEDVFFSFLVFFHAKSILLIENITYYYYRNNYSITGSAIHQQGVNENIAKEYSEIISSIKNFLKENQHKYKKFISHRFLFWFSMRCSMAVLNSKIIPQRDKKRYVMSYYNLYGLPLSAVPFYQKMPTVLYFLSMINPFFSYLFVIFLRKVNRVK